VAYCVKREPKWPELRAVDKACRHRPQVAYDDHFRILYRAGGLVEQRSDVRFASIWPFASVNPAAWQTLRKRFHLFGRGSS